MTENPTQSVPPQSTSFLDDSFARLRGSGYLRDTESRWFGGVCSGLAHRFGVDPVLIRAAAVVLAFLGGIGLTIYVVLWLLMPDQHGDILAERAVRHGDGGPIALLVLAGFLVIGGLFSIGNGNGWFAPLWLIPVAAVVWLVLSRRNPGPLESGYGSPAQPAPYGTAPYGTPPAPAPQGATSTLVPYGTTPPPAPRGAAAPAPGEAMSAPTQLPPPAPYAGPQPPLYRTPQPGTYGGPPATGQGAPYGGRPTPPQPPRPVAPPPPPRPRRRRPSSFVGLMSLGIALVGLGLGAALDDPIGFPGSSATLGFLIALVGVSVVVLTLGLTGRASGFSGFLVVALGLLLLMSSAVSRIDVKDGVGDRTWTPVAATGTTSFQLGAGEATLDLSRLPSDTARPAPQVVNVEMGLGDLTILVPEGLDVRVDASVGLGDITHEGGVGGSTQTSGTDRSTSTVIGEQPVDVVVDAQLGVGQITIQEN